VTLYHDRLDIWEDPAGVEIQPELEGVVVVGDAAGGETIGPPGPQGETGPAGPQGDPGVGVPAGGTIGQVLAKATGTDYDTEWIDPPEGGGGGAPSLEVRSDWVAPYSYMGTAPADTLDSAEAWRIVRIEVETDGTVTVTTADPATWDDRLTEVYS
jgi:hypothetical protein